LCSNGKTTYAECFDSAVCPGSCIGHHCFTGFVKKAKPVVYSHGLVAATALVLLIVYGVQNPDRFPRLSIILFALAAIGGFYLLFNDLKRKPGPVAVAVIHALTAVVGFVTLLLFAFNL
jgi:hypothetical protein